MFCSNNEGRESKKERRMSERPDDFVSDESLVRGSLEEQRSLRIGERRCFKRDKDFSKILCFTLRTNFLKRRRGSWLRGENVTQGGREDSDPVAFPLLEQVRFSRRGAVVSSIIDAKAVAS